MRHYLWPLLGLVTAACSHPEAGTLRFVNQPPVWRVDDRRPLDKIPEERVYNRTLYQFDGFFVRRLTRAMDVPDKGRALDVNSVDESPDSTWFTNRIGVRDMTLDELRRGPNVDPSPLDHLPLTITGGKVGGTALGFVIEDALHQKYLLKFDTKDNPERETGAHIIGHRILYACGYSVPEDYLGYITPADLKLSDKATVKSILGKKSKLTQAMVDHALKTVYQTDDGRIRVLVSRFIEGKPIGPYAREGTRHDDPNDLIPHERRRTVRGERALFSWINHTDIQEDNSFDTFVNEPGSKTKGHVVHYLIDFGKSLGVMNNSNKWTTVGYTYRVDPGQAVLSLLTLGLWVRPWETLTEPPILGIGMFSAENFDPGSWQVNSPYWPFDEADKFDGYWGAKIAMRFTREELTAIVEEAKFSDPRAVPYMVDTLIARQRKVGAYWFGQTSPLDRFKVETPAPGKMNLCFDDLALTYQLEIHPGRYLIDVYDRAGKAIAPSQLAQSTDGHVCISEPTGDTPDRYTIVRLSAYRGSSKLPPVRLHVAETAHAGFTIVGLRRE